MKKRIIIYVLFITFIFLLTGCTDESRFVGTWRTQPVLGVSFGIVFNNNGTISIDGTSHSVGDWKLKDENLIISISTNEEPVTFSGTFDYSFSNNDRTLTIKSNLVEVVLYRQ